MAKTRKKNPFYLGFHYTAPHAPWQNNNQPEHYLSMYENCPFESVPPLKNDDLRDQLKGYYASITAMDANIGRLVDWLEEEGLLLGDSMKERDHLVVYDEYGPVRMIREKEWKYVHRYPYGPHELYDILNDPDERVNLIDAEEQQDTVAAMKAKLEHWFVKYVDPHLDGTHEAVTGEGQIGLAGTAGKGQPAFK